MKEILKKNQAITLVSLVVTIIVLIILVGISINLVLGENGIITKAKQAKENMELAQVEEQKELNELYKQLENNEGSTDSTSYDSTAILAEFKRKIASAITDMGVETSESSNVDTMANNIRSISKGLNNALNPTYKEHLITTSTAATNGYMQYEAIQYGKVTETKSLVTGAYYDLPLYTITYGGGTWKLTPKVDLWYSTTDETMAERVILKKGLDFCWRFDLEYEFYIAKVE